MLQAMPHVQTTYTLDILRANQAKIKTVAHQISIQQWNDHRQQEETVAMCIENSERLDLIVRLVEQSPDPNVELARAGLVINPLIRFVENIEVLCHVY